MRNLRGALLGGFFLAFAENLGVWIFASEWRDLVAFVIFILFLYIRPQGIFQKTEKAVKGAI
jgi:branched-chain amino acid transport system permease protein